MRDLVVPADLRLEAEVVGSIIARYALYDRVRPAWLYDQRHVAILTAWQALTLPTQRYGLIRDAHGVVHPLVEIDGLEDALIAIAPTRARPFYLYARKLVTDAPVATRRDIARLRLLHARRQTLRRLREREIELVGAPW